MTSHPKLKNAVLPICVASVLAAWGAVGQASTMSATAYYNLDGSGTVSVPPWVNDPSTYVDVLEFGSSAAGSTYGIHTYGNIAGSGSGYAFGSRTDGAGVYDVGGTFTKFDTISNTGSGAAAFSYLMELSQGQIAASLFADPSSTEYANAQYDVRIRAKNSGAPDSAYATLWSSAAYLNLTATGYTFTQSGTNIFDSGPQGCNQLPCEGAGWGSKNFTIDLGILNPGESLDIVYEIMTRAWGVSSIDSYTYDYYDWYYAFDDGTGTLTCSSGYGDGGEGGDVGYGAAVESGSDYTLNGDRCERIVTYSTFGPKGWSVAQFGDPDAFNSTPLGYPQTPTTSAVPEPGTLALLAGGMAGVAMFRRRRKQA